MQAAQPVQPSGSVAGSTHLTLGLAAKRFLLLQNDPLFVQLLQLLAQKIYVCCIMSISKSLPSVQYLCLHIVYPFPDRLQLTGSRHPDADVDLSLTAPENESNGREVKSMTTQGS